MSDFITEMFFNPPKREVLEEMLRQIEQQKEQQYKQFIEILKIPQFKNYNNV